MALTNKIYTLIILLLMCYSECFGISCSCEITSLDNKKYAITIHDEYLKKYYVITNGRDSIISYNYTGIGSPINCSNVGKYFVKVTSPNSKGNQGLYDIMLLCINNGKLFVVLNINGDEEFYFEDKIISSDVQLNIENRYKYININYKTCEIVSKKNQRKCLKYNIKAIFNHKLNIAFEKYRLLNGNFDIIMYYNKETKRKLFGYYPSVQLYNYTYYFIDGIWYRKSNDKNKLLLYESYKIKY